MKFFLIALLFCFSLISCNKSGNEINYLKAKIVITSEISCGLPVLSFEEDSLKIRRLTNITNINYAVLKLPANFNIENKSLYVLVRTLNPEEEFVCNTLGISYPHLKILDVKNR